MRTHTHTVAGAAAGPCFPATCPTPIQIERSLMHGNGSHEDDVFTRDWTNETLNNSALTEGQIKLKYFILSDQELTAKVFGTVFIEENDNVREEEDYQSNSASPKLLGV